MIYQLITKYLSIAVDSFGAELVSVVYNGKERLWQNESGNWSGHAPVLFPMCGVCSYKLEGEYYPIGMHGFAWKSQFVLKRQTRNSLSLELASNEQTRRIFPFDFLFAVTYKIVSSKLKITLKVRNLSNKTMPCSLGTHVSFALDSVADNYSVVFPQTEQFISHVHDVSARLTGERLDCGTGNKLVLSAQYLDNNNTIIFSDLKSNYLYLTENATNKKLAKVTFGNYPFLLFWRAVNSDMICIEPWHNLPDDRNNDVEFSQKQGIINLKHGKYAKRCQTIEYLD